MPKKTEIVVGETVPQDVNVLLAALDESRRTEIVKNEKRWEMARELSKYRLGIAQEIHRLVDGSPMDLDSRPFQKEILKDVALDTVIYGSAQWGKAAPLDSLIHTPFGWIEMGDVKIGDRVSIPDGGDAGVIGVFPQGSVPIYKVTFIDGRSAEACGDHLWEVHSHDWKKKSPQVITTKELKRVVELCREKGRTYRFRIPLTKPIDMPEADLPLDPYVMGQMLGDGEMSRKNLRYTTADAQLVGAMNELLPDGMWLKNYSGDSEYNFRICTKDGKTGRLPGGAYIQHPMAGILGPLGLIDSDCYTKFIPERYKLASPAQRLALLQGLMDTDGEASVNASFSSSSKQLAEDVRDLIRSLGGIASINQRRTQYTYKGVKKTGEITYRVNIRHRDPRSLFRLPRKQANITANYRQAETLQLAVESVEYVGEKEAQCILIDHPRHLYITNDYVVTHNSEMLICTAFAAAGGCGLKVLWVLSKADKRNKFVSDRINPAFSTVPTYKRMAEQARQRGGRTDSVGLKHMGFGAINLVFSSSPSELTSWSSDICIIDEMQDCTAENLHLVTHRMTGSDFGFMIRVGHPTVTGTDENSNLDWFYQNSDARRWRVPCISCGMRVELNWWKHIVLEERNKYGGIVSVRPRDEQWKPGGLDMRPICDNCHRPMHRFHREAAWEASNPGHSRHGFKLGNLYNPAVTTQVASLYEEYLGARHNPGALSQFYMKQLGLPFDTTSDRISKEMLDVCASGENTKVPPYRFHKMSSFDWARAVDEHGAI